MDLLKHDIATEFPQFKARIHELKTHQQHFAKLYASYDQVNHDIGRIESEGSPVADEALETLKKQRLRLKDEIVQMLHS